MDNPSNIITPEIISVQTPTSSAPLKAIDISEPDCITTGQLYDAVYENAFHAMYIGNGGGKVIKFNKKFSQLFGFSIPETEQIKPADLFETNDPSFISFINERKQKGIAKAEIRCIKKSGERFPCRISSIIYQSDKGEKRSMNTLINISKSIQARWNVAG